MTKAKHHETEPTAAAGKPICGLVMPISAMGDYSASHWGDVKAIITETLPDWEVRLVSDADGAGVIQRRIIENLYSDPFVIVDVSGRNPNVMFELGMRLAFDKPTLVIKDSDTPYPFDIAPNEYLGYPRNLRFHEVVEFKKRLAAKVEATNKPEHRTFLKDFGHIKVPTIASEEVPADRLFLERLDRIESAIATMANRSKWRWMPVEPVPDPGLPSEAEMAQMRMWVRKHIGAARDRIDHDMIVNDAFKTLGPRPQYEDFKVWWLRIEQNLKRLDLK